MVKMSVSVEEEIHRQLKVYCAKNGFSIQDFVAEAIAVKVAVVTPAQQVEPKLSKSRKCQIQQMFSEVLDSGDLLATDYLRAMIRFYSAHLSSKQA